MAELTMDKLVALCKNRGLIFAGSEIYGGLANTWDYGPLGVELKNNIKKAWWQKFVQESKYNTGLDCAILMNREVWVASGHVGGFNDPLMDSVCGKKNFTGIRQFNLMFKTHSGVTEDSTNEIYLRPETAQGIFVNFQNVMRTTRKKLPAGIAQIGKSFRNEITPGNFIFRVREFEQMELEFFCKPGEDLEWFNYWRSFCRDWLVALGMKEDHLRLRDHEPEKLAFYSKATTDFEFLFPFGWGELWGVADRTDYDLTQHQEHSGKSMEYLDPVTNEKFIPYCIEPSLGVDRALLAFLCNAYEEEELEGGDVRTVLHLHPALAPFKAAVLPLQKNKLGALASSIHEELTKYFAVDYDETASIGKRYRRQDEIGTPFAICVDFETEETQTVTVRDRDTMQQERVAIKDLRSYIEERMRF